MSSAVHRIVSMRPKPTGRYHAQRRAPSPELAEKVHFCCGETPKACPRFCAGRWTGRTSK